MCRKSQSRNSDFRTRLLRQKFPCKISTADFVAKLRISATNKRQGLAHFQIVSVHIWDYISYMGTESTNQNQALAAHLRMLRVNRGLTLQDLASSSGVSRATLSRIENGEVSPTAETLGRLASAFALPLSQLLTPMEPDFPPLIRRADQSIWSDRENGFSRRTLSPPNGRLKLEMIECEIAPNQRIAYDRPAFLGHEHHLVVLGGALILTVDDVQHDLSAGDCLRYQLRGASIFATGDQPARYIIAMA